MHVILFFFGFGIFSFFWGFKRLRRKRLIENIPTSTVRSLALGLVELYGKAEQTANLKSPFTNEDCVLFEYKVEQYCASGKSSRWVTIAKGDSFHCPFWLNDGTGKILVYPKGAELILPVDYSFRTDCGDAIPSNIIDFMERKGIPYKNWVFKTLRFTEWFIAPGEYVYVLGTAKKLENSNINYKDQLMRRINELKESQKEMEELDIDKDGKISIEEWDLAVKKLEEEVLNEALKSPQLENSSDVVIGQGDIEKVFIISDHSEKELQRRLLYECLFGIYGGAILSLICLIYLLSRFLKHKTVL